MTHLASTGVRRHFPIRGGLLGRRVGEIHAVDRADVAVERGSTLGLVGESGCGKTTLGRILVGLLEPDAGAVTVGGEDLHRADRQTRRALRPRVQMVFQDTQSSLDPRMTVEQSVTEPMRINRLAHGDELLARVAALVERCGLGAEYLQRYPHELSGGQRQRVVIARALATEPDVVVLDEPTSALDVSVQAQILNLLKDLQQELGLAYVFISHDLAVVRWMSDDVAVMYLGEIVEHGPAATVLADPRHPYTRTLVGSMPAVDPALRRRGPRPVGDVPRADQPPSGCRFHPRCPRAESVCPVTVPEPREVAGRGVACHFAEDPSTPEDACASE